MCSEQRSRFQINDQFRLVFKYIMAYRFTMCFVEAKDKLVVSVVKKRDYGFLWLFLALSLRFEYKIKTSFFITIYIYLVQSKCKQIKSECVFFEMPTVSLMFNSVFQKAQISQTSDLLECCTLSLLSWRATGMPFFLIFLFLVRLLTAPWNRTPQDHSPTPYLRTLIHPRMC